LSRLPSASSRPGIVSYLAGAEQTSTDRTAGAVERETAKMEWRRPGTGPPAMRRPRMRRMAMALPRDTTPPRSRVDRWRAGAERRAAIVLSVRPEAVPCSRTRSVRAAKAPRFPLRVRVSPVAPGGGVLSARMVAPWEPGSRRRDGVRPGHEVRSPPAIGRGSKPTRGRAVSARPQATRSRLTSPSPCERSYGQGIVRRARLAPEEGDAREAPRFGQAGRPSSRRARRAGGAAGPAGAALVRVVSAAPTIAAADLSTSSAGVAAVARDGAPDRLRERALLGDAGRGGAACRAPRLPPSHAWR
jgi:hypothetical protein